MGDVLSAALVFVGTAGLSLGTTGFARVNVVLAVAWVALAWQVGRTYRGHHVDGACSRQSDGPHERAPDAARGTREGPGGGSTTRVEEIET